MKNKKLVMDRPGDLAPTGVKYTIKGDYTFNEVFEHIYLNGIKFGLSNIKKNIGKK